MFEVSPRPLFIAVSSFQWIRIRLFGADTVPLKVKQTLVILSSTYLYFLKGMQGWLSCLRVDTVTSLM